MRTAAFLQKNVMMTRRKKIVIAENPSTLLIDICLVEIDSRNTIRVSVAFLVVATREEIGEVAKNLLIIELQVAKNLLVIEFRHYLRIQHKRND